MANRTFGWIQNPSSTETLRNIVSIFVSESSFSKEMRNKRLPFLASAGLFKSPDLYSEFLKLLKNNKRIPYEMLKGQGAGKDGRKNAKCSGLVQAAIDGQQSKTYKVDGKNITIKKPYTDDWTADGFLRWAVSIGFLDYNYDDDTCSITKNGVAFVNADQSKRNEILGNAFLSYPPVCRVLGLLSKKGHLTKFEIGRQLGFSDEPGFTSFPQNIWVQAYEESADNEEKKKLRSDTEGSSDKYARMICGWLEGINWVTKRPKVVEEKYGGKIYHCQINSSFEITAKGLQNYRNAIGNSSHARIPKIVYREMLASKASNADYLRMRRSMILDCLRNHKQYTYNDILQYLSNKKLSESIDVVTDDIKGLVNIGLDLEIIGNNVKLKDEIQKLYQYAKPCRNDDADVTIIKERVRSKLKHIDHKYLTLIDYAFSGKDKCAEFEVYTIDLLTNELSFSGKHLGGSRKPDGVFYYNKDGVIMDNKAYSKGFTITRSMADEMTRYVQENTERSVERNPNCWWSNFDKNVNHFNFVFISSKFKGEVDHMLQNIKASTGVNGCALNVENLLYYADQVKCSNLSYEDFIRKFNQNSEI